MQSLKQRLRDDFPRLAFTGAFLLAAAGTCVVLGGLAAITNFCIENQPLGLGNGFKLEAPLTPFATELMRIQRAPVSTETGAFSCGRFFRYDWFLWAFQLVWLCIVGAAWYRGTVDRYKSALWAIGATITAWHMYKIDFICTMDFWTKGEVHTDGLITAGGLIMCCLGNFFMMLSGCAYAEVEAARAAAVAAADGTSSEEDVKRGGGKSVGSFSTAV